MRQTCACGILCRWENKAIKIEVVNQYSKKLHDFLLCQCLVVTVPCFPSHFNKENWAWLPELPCISPDKTHSTMRQVKALALHAVESLIWIKMHIELFYSKLSILEKEYSSVLSFTGTEHHFLWNRCNLVQNASFVLLMSHLQQLGPINGECDKLTIFHRKKWVD